VALNPPKASRSDIWPALICDCLAARRPVSGKKFTGRTGVVAPASSTNPAEGVPGTGVDATGVDPSGVEVGSSPSSVGVEVEIEVGVGVRVGVGVGVGVTDGVGVGAEA
jgi:hypothetical protein